MTDGISVEINGETYAEKLSDAVVIIPPFMQLGPVNLKRMKTPTLLTLSPQGRNRSESATALALNTLSLAMLGMPMSKNFLGSERIKVDDTVSMRSDLPETIVASPIIPTSLNISVTSGRTFPPIKVIRIKK